MSGAFKGFSDNDLQKMKNETGSSGPNPGKEEYPVMKNKIITAIKNKNKNQQPVRNEPVDEKAKLSKTPNKPMAQNTQQLEEPVKKEPENEIPTLEINSENNNTRKIIEEIKEMTTIELEKPINVEEFQLQQRLIEEQNRKRKEMLSKALEDRKKQTVEEAVRIEKIKKELETLDAQLSDDVSILRKQIDKSSLTYTEAEKYYHKVEMEYLAAKLNLQKEKERKELLTEHLCTLIAHNETRKAKKLESLMDQLVYSTTHTPSSISDGVCEKTGKMLEMEDGQYVVRDD